MKMATYLLEVAADVTTNPPADWMVITMGVGVVFLGLVLIIVLCKIMGCFFVGTTKSESQAPEVKSAPVAQKSTAIENRQEIIAAVTAVCAEDMGKDVSALRVISFKKL